jgi:hypothetical protein
MQNIKRTAAIFAAALLIALTPSCEILKDVSNTITNIKRLKFKIAGVSDVRVSGISTQGKKGLKDFSTSAIAKLSAAAVTKKMPVSFTLHVDAINPNDGTKQTQSTKSTISALPWTLYIQDKPTISGNISKPIHVPSTGTSVDIPIQINFDIFEFFKNKGYKDIVELVLAISGAEGHEGDLKLKAQPSVTTKYGTIKYPGELTIVKNEWTN